VRIIHREGEGVPVHAARHAGRAKRKAAEVARRHRVEGNQTCENQTKECRPRGMALYGEGMVRVWIEKAVRSAVAVPKTEAVCVP